MFEAHLMSALVGAGGDQGQGVISSTEFDVRVSDYLNNGWKVESFQTVQSSPLAIQITILFIRETKLGATASAK